MSDLPVSSIGGKSLEVLAMRILTEFTRSSPSLGRSSPRRAGLDRTTSSITARSMTGRDTLGRVATRLCCAEKALIVQGGEVYGLGATYAFSPEFIVLCERDSIKADLSTTNGTLFP